MPRRWKETSFLGTSRSAKVRVPFDVELEDAYENVHRSMGDLRPSRSHGNSDPYYSPSRRDSAHFAGSMGVIPAPGTEVTVTESKEIGIVEGNRRIPLASFQRDVVMAQSNNMRRAESMSTFTSSGMARNTNAAGVSFASGWHEQRVVVDSERETSIIAMRTTASSSKIHYPEGSHNNKPVHDDEFLKGDYKMHIYGDTSDLCQPYGFSNYPEDNSFKPSLDVHHPDLYHHDHIYDEIQESDKVDQHTCDPYSGENLYENVRKPVIINERLKKPGVTDGGNYANERSFASSENRVHHSSSFRNDIESPSVVKKHKTQVFQPISGCKSTPNLTTFSGSNQQLISEGNLSVENVNDHSEEKLDSDQRDAKRSAVEEKVQVPYMKKPYLETNLDDILWLPTPTKSDSSVKQPDDSTAANKTTPTSSETELTAKPSAEYTSIDKKISTQTETAPTTSTSDENLSLSVLGLAKPEVTDQNGKSGGSDEFAMVKDPTTTISDGILSQSVPDIPKPKETDQNGKITGPNEFASVNDKLVPATDPTENQYVADDKDISSEVAEISSGPNGENMSPSVPGIPKPKETDHNNKSRLSDECAVVSDATTVFDENLSLSASGIPKPEETDHNGKLGGSVECAIVNDKDFGISVEPVPTTDPTENQYVADDKDRRTSEVAEPSSKLTGESLTTTSFLEIETTTEQFKESFPAEKDSDIAMVTKGTTEEVKRNVSNVHKNSIKVPLMNETQKSRTSKKSVKRPSCPPPPPPKVDALLKTESTLVPKEPGVATPETDIPVSPSPDPAESTLNLGFISDEKAILPGDQENNELKHSSEACPLDYVDRDNGARCMAPQRYLEGYKKDMKDEGDARCKNTLLEKEQNSFQGEMLGENKNMSETVLQENSDDKIELANVNSVSNEHEKEKTVESDQYDSASKEKFSVMQLSNENVSGESIQSPNISDLDIQGEEMPDEVTSDFDTASETLVDQLPDDVTFEETDPKEPPPYTPPPPPPKSESSESQSVASAEESRSDLEGHRSPSPPPRPPSPLAYTGPSTPPLYFSSPLPDLEGTNVLEGQINPSPLPHTEELASVAQRNLVPETDLRHSPSPPPIPPRPKHIGKFFYHPAPSLDFHKHVYENLLYSQGKGDHIGGTQSFRNDIFAEAESQYEILYENINNLQIQRDSLANRAESQTGDNECIYENLRRSAICNDTLTDPAEQECIYENVKSLKDTSDKVAGINRVSSPRAQTYEYSDTYEENILGHTYETINKSRGKNQVRDHIYDIIRTDESEIGEHQARNKSQSHERTVESDDSYHGYLYATVNKTKSVDKKNTSSESSILNHTYAVIDRSQTEDSFFHKDDYPEEIYENIPPRNTPRNQDESHKRVLFQDDCIYENLGVSRKSLRDHHMESTGHSSDATVVSSASLHCDSLAYSGEERAGTPEDRPPTPPPRQLPGVTGIPFRPTYSPPPPPIPPFNPEAYLQAEEQRFLASFNSASSHRQLGRESEDIEKELSFDYQREVQEFLHLQKQRRRWHKERRRCQPQQQIESGNRAMMEFYVNNLTSDSDSDNDSAGSSTSASGGSHDLEEEVVEHQQQMLDRTYQVIGGADTVLDTIEEDVEEDSGAESSGHWMFSADNTDTDSVIHVPAILDLRPYPVEAVKESESTDSDGTIVTEEDVTESVCRPEVASNSSSRQETGVTEGNSHVEEAPASHHPHPHPHPGSSASDEEEEEENDDSDLGSRGVEPVTVGGGRVGSPTYPSSDAAAKDHSGIRSRSERDSNGGVNAGDCKGRGGGGLPAG
ncbi:uncharacterized protein LOC135216074 isoform X1 [Macrobrachium nipponense]|uniref:uncharacterized protein LOC135216074 isoform X1 n=1 Tax=Macrobrachium nipponense TaxID=159736 RepID=UPI0030C7AADB